jgi:hypothetical protein
VPEFWFGPEFRDLPVTPPGTSFHAYNFNEVEALARVAQIRQTQRAKVGWDRLNPLLDRWIPMPRVLHPYPDKRFDAIHPR